MKSNNHVKKASFFGLKLIICNLHVTRQHVSTKFIKANFKSNMKHQFEQFH